MDSQNFDSAIWAANSHLLRAVSSTKLNSYSSNRGGGSPPQKKECESLFWVMLANYSSGYIPLRCCSGWDGATSAGL
jgi:hypothetical protein